MNSKQSSIIITGSNQGIGLECVKQFCGLFPEKLIIAISRSVDSLKQLVYANLKYIQCDVSDYRKLQYELDKISENYKMEGLIASAGTAYSGDFCNLEYEKHQQMIDVNIAGLTNTIEIVLPYLRQNSFGTIINISSLADRYPRPRSAVYGASKAYVKSLSDSLRVSEAKNNIRVCNISPALIDTPLGSKVRPDVPKLTVTEFTNIIKFIYTQPQNICIRDLVVAPTDYES